MLPHLQSRAMQLNQEFAFFPTAPPHAQGGLFELRTYQLQPGALLEWENVWYVLHSAFIASTDFCNPGVEALKPVGSLLHPWVLGSHKLGGFIKHTTCGSIRKSFLIYH